MAMNLERHVEAHWEMFDHLVQGDGEPLSAKRRFYDEYRSVMDLSSTFYLQTIHAVFKEHLLPRGLLMHRGHRIDVSAIERTAILTIEGERDDISGLGQTRATHLLAHRLAAKKHGHLEQPGVGHYGLFNGQRFRTQVAPAIKAFMQTHGGVSRSSGAKTLSG
jgi:poly(3-hydroxybutyrate) depolymerase